MRGTKTRNRAFLPLLSLAAIALFPGCGDDTLGLTPGDPVDRTDLRPTWELVVEPADPYVAVGETIQLRAYLRHSETGALGLQVTVRWASENLKMAMVSDQGLVEVYGAGTVVITASRGRSGGAPEEAIARVQVR